MWHNLFPYTALRLDIPTLIYKLTINKVWKVWFSAIPLVFFFLVPSPAPCLVLTQPQTPSAPSVAPSNPGKKRPTPELRRRLISSAHLEAGWGLTGDHGGQGLDLLAVSSSVTHSGDWAAAAFSSIQHRAPSDIQYMLQQSWVDQA